MRSGTTVFISTTTDQLYDRNVNPGGWVEFQDLDMILKSDDGTLREGSETVKWIRYTEKACDQVGVEVCCSWTCHLPTWTYEMRIRSLHSRRDSF